MPQSLQQKRFFILAVVSLALLALVMTLMIAGYGKLKALKEREKNARDPNKLQVLVAVDPCAYFVERIGADRVQVATLTPEGKSPETFAPTPAQLSDFASSQLFFLTGLAVEERFLANIQSIAPNAVVVDLRRGLELLPDPHRHSHEGEDVDEDARDHDGDALLSETPNHPEDEWSPQRDKEDLSTLDPHLWTSPQIARSMVAKILEALIQLAPDAQETFRANAAELDQELAALQTRTRDALDPYQGNFFLVFHPAYGYYAREFGIEQRAIENEGKTPSPRELEELVRDSREQKIAALIVQPEFNRASAQVVADALGAELVVHSPLQKDYFENIDELTAAILQSFGAERPAALPVYSSRR
ncbi:MAG: metal ABC transporter solute-binding protein, Zn/Mn family [Thermoguttaceae bacterium]